jgi:hypothetical protein
MLAFRGDPEPHPARDQDLHPRTDREEVRDERGGIDHVLEVVEHEQEVSLPQHSRHPLEQRRVARPAHAERRDDGRGHERGVDDRAEGNEDDAVGEGVAHGRRGSQGEPRLADPTGASQGQESDIVPLQQVAGRGHLVLPPHQRRHRHRQPRAEERVASQWAARAFQCAAGRDHEGCSLRGTELERIDQEPQRIPPRSCPNSTLQVADAAHTQPRALGQGFLREPRGDAVSVQ